MKSKLKTIPLDVEIETYLSTLPPTQAEEGKHLIELFERITHEKAQLWRGDMIGFGQYHYHYATGHEGDAMKCGFALRKTNITLYLLTDAYLKPDQTDELLLQLGKFSGGKSCFYVKRLSDIDLSVLERLIHRSLTLIDELYGPQ
jgi:hypothetical protein